tara:strand:- start:1425 stop:1706 length:282 start_codon:yes stop_codon:yes gene_type:complete
MSIILENQIPPDQRFVIQNTIEYNVFSTEVEDATLIEKWIGLEWPHKVLMDAETYARLRNRRIEFQFDEKKSVQAVLIKESGDVKESGEVKGE